MAQCASPNDPDWSLNANLHVLCVNSVGLFMYRLIRRNKYEILSFKWVSIASLLPVCFLALQKKKQPGPPFYWPLARAAITHDSNEQSAEIPQNKIHPPKARALTLSAWKNISVRDSSIIHPQTRDRLSVSLPLLCFCSSINTNYKARTPLTESGGNPHIISIIWPDRGSGFLPRAITSR